METYSAAENISVLQEELNYFNNKLLTADGEAVKYIKRRITEINGKIKRYSVNK